MSVGTVLLVDIGRPSPWWVAPFPKLGPELCKGGEGWLRASQQTTWIYSFLSALVRIGCYLDFLTIIDHHLDL